MTRMSDPLERVAEALERMAPAPMQAPNFETADAFVWRVAPDALVPVQDVSRVDINLLVGASYAGILAGMIGITPAGIGVREGVITTILATQMGIGDATAFAVLSRAWEFGAEMLFLGAASWWDHKKRGPQPKDKQLSRYPRFVTPSCN